MLRVIAGHDIECPARERVASRALLLDFAALRDDKRPIPYSESASGVGALGGTRTPNLQIRRSRHVVQDHPSPSVRWADIPESSLRVRRCLAAWQQNWQQSRCLPSMAVDHGLACSAASETPCAVGGP